MEISIGKLSQITNKVLPELEAWRGRPLDSVYTIVYLDAIHFKVREEGRVKNKALYNLMGIRTNGHKDLLGLYLGESEGAKFWLSVLTDIQNRVVKDILVACIDNLSGFSEAIQSIFPQARVQLCIVHQVRNSLRYVVHEDSKKVVKALKDIYQASSFWRKQNWSWKILLKNGDQVVVITRKHTKSKGVLPADMAVLKLQLLPIGIISINFHKMIFAHWRYSHLGFRVVRSLGS